MRRDTENKWCAQEVSVWFYTLRSEGKILHRVLKGENPLRSQWRGISCLASDRPLRRLTIHPFERDELDALVSWWTLPLS